MPTNRACGPAAFYEYSGNYVEQHYELLMAFLPALLGGIHSGERPRHSRCPVYFSAAVPIGLLCARVIPARSGGSGKVQESLAITFENCQLLLSLNSLGFIR